MNNLLSNLRGRPRSIVLRVSVLSLLASTMAVSSVGAEKLQSKLSNPPARCLNAIRKVNMILDETGPKYYFVFTVDALAYCRPDDWVSAARARVSKFRTIEDYNYQRVPAIALAGKDLISLRRWMCDWMMQLRRENKTSDAYRVLLACGERPGTDTRKGVKVITTTSVSTQTTLPARPPSVVIQPRQNFWQLSTLAQVIENGNGYVVKDCVLLNGRDFYDVAESLGISDGKGNRQASGPLCNVRPQPYRWPVEPSTGKPGFTTVSPPIQDQYAFTDLSGCTQDATGRITICKTVSVSRKFVFTNGREVISNSFPIYLRNLANVWFGETGEWTFEFYWMICKDPVADGNWTDFCPSGAN